jgi:general secretion pathway protein G
MRQRKIRAFTLVELMVVVAILGILSTVVVLSLSGQTHTAKLSVVKSDMSTIRDALELYKMNMNAYPEKLEYLVTAPPETGTGSSWAGPYIKGGVPRDPWTMEYQYNPVSATGQGYDLYSFGADRQAGGEGENKDLTIQELLYGQTDQTQQATQ